VGRVHEEQRRLLSTTRVLLHTTNHRDRLLRSHIRNPTLAVTANSSAIRGRNRSNNRTHAPVRRVQKEPRCRRSTTRILLRTTKHSDGRLRRHISSATLINTNNSSPIRGRNRSPHRTRAPVGRVHKEQRRRLSTTRILLHTTHQRDRLLRSHIRRTTLAIHHSTPVSRRNRSPHSTSAPVGRVHEEKRRLMSTTRVLLHTTNRSDRLLRRHI